MKNNDFHVIYAVFTFNPYTITFKNIPRKAFYTMRPAIYKSLAIPYLVLCANESLARIFFELF